MRYEPNQYSHNEILRIQERSQTGEYNNKVHCRCPDGVLYAYPDPDPSIRLCSSCGGEYTMHEINYYEKEDIELCEGCDYHD